MVTLANTSVYFLQALAGALIIALLAFLVLFGSRGFRRYIVTWMIIVLIILHYSIVLVVSGIAKVTILPLVIIEHDSYGGSIYPDYGQLAVLVLIILWRKEVFNTITSFSKRLMQSGGSGESPQAGESVGVRGQEES
ncbi:MAG: hypothetical protein QXO22_05495 [Thermosphaera sp.]